MKNLTKNMIFAAAALVVAAGAASAQVIKAEIPFSFRAGTTVLPAGEYQVRPANSGGAPIFQLTNADSHSSTFAMPYPDNSRAPRHDPKLKFECGESLCTLVALDPGEGQTYKFHRPNLGNNENTTMAVIRAVLVKSR